jgi:stage II sporulation protein D
LEGANLLNYSGSGYALGYFDEDLQFVPLMRTEERAISMLKDWSLYYVGGQYVSKGSSDNLQVGCYHIRLGSWETCEEAMEEASDYSDGFVGYINGTWYAFCGSYLSQTAAENAASSRGIFGTAATASSRCVTVVATGTDRVIFQYDGGTESSLGVMPLPDGDGGRPITWFRGYKYYGGFQYTRRDGGNLTVVNVLEMDDYICGVVPYEMSPSWPMEALKAQAVSARTYAASQLHKHESSGFDLCNSTCCQAYLGVNVNAADCEEAVRDTSGIYVTYEGEYADTYYHSCDGGATENSENVFYEAIPYLKGVRDPYESYVHTGYEHWSYVYTADEITWILQNKGYKCSRIVSITPTYTDVGNILSLRFTDSAGVSWTFSRSRAASILNSSTYNRIIHSQRFTVTDGSSEHASVSINDAAVRVTDTENLCAVDGSGQVHSIGEMGSFAVITGTGIETVTLNGSGETIVSERFLISGSGWGHNVGMSQYGAKAMAELGFTYDEILKFYFTGVDVG